MNNTDKAEKVKLICMSFDGEYQIERPTFDSIGEAWNYSNDLGSKWFFYPFHFVTTASGKTIKDTPEMLEHLKGLRVKSLANHFAEVCKTPEAINADCEAFMFLV